MKTKTVLLALSVTAILIASLGFLLVQHALQRNRTLGFPRTRVVPTRTFEVRGVVRAVDVANHLIRITHEEIPNYMPAMTMPFSVKEPSPLAGIAPGDNVQFELAVTETDSWIAHLEKIPVSEALLGLGSVSGTLKERETERLQPGETVPDFELTDQDGQPVRLSDFRGKAVVLTFIYTRCPLPNYCPLISRNFAELEQRLSKEFAGKYHLLTITIDPQYDRPEVLKDYAIRYSANSADWTFATGTAEQTSFVAGLTGLYFARENGLISHDLRTALIGPDGKLVHLWKSNVWTPYEVQRMVRERLTGNRDFAAKWAAAIDR